MASSIAQLVNSFHAQIGVVDAVTAELREIAGSTACLLVAGVGETVGVDIRHAILRSLMNTDASGQRLTRTTGSIRSLVAICDAAIAHRNVEWLSGLKGGEGRKLPATNEGIQEAIHVRADQGSATYRQLQHRGQYKAIGRIIRAHRPFGLEIIQLLRISVVQGSDKRIKPGGRVVRILRPRVVALEIDITSCPLLEDDLQGVVPRGGNESRQALKDSIKLRIRAQEVEQRQLGIAITRFRFVKDGVWAR